MDMPIIDLEYLAEKLNSNDLKIVKGIVATQGPNKGRLRASKPPLGEKVQVECLDNFTGFAYIYKNAKDERKGMSAYVWRMVAFFISPLSVHHHMPMTADFDLSQPKTKMSHELARQLDDLVEIVVDSIPREQWHGAKRWARCF